MVDQTKMADAQRETLPARPPAQPQTQPSPPAKPSRSSRAFESFLAWIFRFFTLLSVGYLVYDRYYETSATIISPASDPTNPFYFPFSLVNNSHIFSLRNLDWACELVDVKYDNGVSLIDVNVVDRAHKTIVSPGGTTNIFCNKGGIVVARSKMQSAIVKMQASYDVDIFGLFNLHKESPVVTFTWMPSPTETRHQWIKGDL